MTPTVTYSLTATCSKTGRVYGTYINAIDYPVDEQDRAEAEWAAKLAWYQGQHPQAQGVAIRRSSVWQKPSAAEQAQQIAAANAAVAFDFSNIWDD